MTTAKEPAGLDTRWHPTWEQLIALIRQERPVPTPDENGDVHCQRLWPVERCTYVHGHYGGCATR
jgi:hypothetical protein